MCGGRSRRRLGHSIRPRRVLGRDFFPAVDCCLAACFPACGQREVRWVVECLAFAAAAGVLPRADSIAAGGPPFCRTPISRTHPVSGPEFLTFLKKKNPPHPPPSIHNTTPT